MPATAKICFRHDTTANWLAANPILLKGEIGIEYTVAEEVLFKIGKGTQAQDGTISGPTWNELPYASGMQGLPPQHEWNGTNLHFRNPDGTWGLSVNLKGERGVKGDKGDTGEQGPVGPPYKLPPATKTVLGGIKVGKNLEITLDGCLSAADPFYTPIRGIIMYNGAIGGSDGRRPIWNGEVNEDWVLCDGITTNGVPVPDLRDKFIVGAGHLYNINTTGGALSHTHEIFKTNIYPSATNSSQRHDSRNTNATVLLAKNMPHHTHVIHASGGWAQIAWGHGYGQALAWADPTSVNDANATTDWNKLPEDKKCWTAGYPPARQGKGFTNITNSSKDDNYFGNATLTSRQKDEEMGYTHWHRVPQQPTEPAEVIPPYHALIYLIRVQ